MAEKQIPVAELQAVRRRTFHALHEWNRSGARGSARPVFDRAYRDTRHVEQADQVLKAQHREWIWREWLDAGRPLTPTVMVELRERLTPDALAWLDGSGAFLRAIPGGDASAQEEATRMRLRAQAAHLREPGEDDDDPTPSRWWDD